MKQFEKINKAYNNVFKQNQLSIGLVVPIENYALASVPNMKNHLERVQLIEQLGFKSLWLRDVPFNVPSFGDAGQTYDPFTYLGFLAAQTSEIGLGIASIALPLHHPVHIAKSAATIDQLSDGRILLGIASGDRFDEYPAMGIDYETRGEQFRDAYTYIRKAQDSFSEIESEHFGSVKGHIDILPKPLGKKIPMLLTGGSRQTPDWGVKNSDGWMTYPRDLYSQQHTIRKWRSQVINSQEYDKPFMQPLYIDLQANDNFKPQPIHLGFKIGANYLNDYFNKLETIGVNHVALNLRFNSLSIEETLNKIASKVLPNFHSINSKSEVL
ncbi:MAG: LLM class oxidoreductase [Bacteroidetes bacterium MedPE-SWsnd-G1]|nr:MAG: LLM class oxidoreductase [Bacteroidetes bacterium MedPE-SWsnd-G1]